MSPTSHEETTLHTPSDVTFGSRQEQSPTHQPKSQSSDAPDSHTCTPDTHARPSRRGYYTRAVTVRAPWNEKLGRRTYPVG